MYIQPLRAFFLALLLLGFAGCAGRTTSTDDLESQYQEAEEAFKDERYLVAIEKYRDIKNRYPYSQRATDSELRIADCYFEQESYIEAESAYEIFRELHPTHPKSDYVYYRIALSYFNQIPSNSARDLSAAYRAIDAFNQLMNKFPNSEYSAKAKEYIQDSRRKLAEAENGVADFYFRRKHFLSASYRYSALLQEFPNLGYDEEGLYRLGVCYYNTRMYANARDALSRLVSQYPQSELRTEAESLLKDLTVKN